jgi:hypothetical protein
MNRTEYHSQSRERPSLGRLHAGPGKHKAASTEFLTDI